MKIINIDVLSIVVYITQCIIIWYVLYGVWCVCTLYICGGMYCAASVQQQLSGLHFTSRMSLLPCPTVVQEPFFAFIYAQIHVRSRH